MSIQTVCNIIVSRGNDIWFVVTFYSEVHVNPKSNPVCLSKFSSG
jgi:hypothetical protein